MIPHSRPCVGLEEERAVLRVLRSRQLGGGEEVDRFESGLSRFLGGGRATAVHTGSLALEIALRALRVGRGDRVVIPTYVCAAVLHAVRRAGAEADLADVDPATAVLDADLVRPRLRARTKAVIVPHLLGRRAPVEEIRRLGVPVIEDCAMAMGGGTGLLGDVSVFSFYATKMMATGHGGAVASRDRRLAETMRDLVDYDNRDDDVPRWNGRMSAIAAAVGRAQLRKLPEFVQRRRRIADYYYRTLGLGKPPRGHVFHRFALRVGSVDRFVRFMAERGVECKRPVWRPLHRTVARAGGEFPGAEERHRHWVSIPLYPDLSRGEMARVAGAALRALAPV